MLRVGLLCVSRGSNDALLWENLASQMTRIGLIETYRHQGAMNHPPLSGLWAAGVYRAAQETKIPFYLLFKIPVVLCDAITCLLLYLIWRHRSGARAGLLAAAAFAWSLNAILLSAHHCNTDSIYAMLCVLALWLARKHPFPSGLALGAAINVKLIPALLVLPLLGTARRWREAAWMLAGLCLAAIPFLWMFIVLPYRFRMRVLGYQPGAGGWGIGELLETLAKIDGWKPYLSAVLDRYAAGSKTLIFASIALATLLLRRKKHGDRFAASAIAVLLFAILAPSFALQYGAIVGAVLFAYDLRAGAWWGAIRGLQLFCDYYLGWDGTIPITSLGGNLLGSTVDILAMLAWLATLLVLLRAMHLFYRRTDAHVACPDLAADSRTAD